MKKLTHILFAVTLSLYAFSAKSAEINGTFTNSVGKMVYLERFQENRPVKVDSIAINKKGKFKFTIKDTLTDFYRISFQPTDFIVLIISKNDKAEITADGTSLNKTYKIKGSANSENLLAFVNLVNKYIKEKDSINTLVLKNNDGTKNDLVAQLNAELNLKYTTFIKDRNKFMDDHPASPALVAVTNHLNLQNDAKGELVHLKKIDLALEKSIPNTYYHKSIHDMVISIEEQIKAEEKQKELEANKAKMYDPGTEAKDIVMMDENGKELKLSSLKGQYVLIDFWASWCGPCRKENPNVVKLYEKYKDKGFTIYSVSLDNNKEKWLEAIKKDNLTWPNHVSELKGWQTSVLGDYGVNAIPFTVLIDKEGKIVQAHLRGPALELKLKEIFGF
jgi:thiol-disulfide isomerase/thioredoxin